MANVRAWCLTVAVAVPRSAAPSAGAARAASRLALQSAVEILDDTAAPDTAGDTTSTRSLAAGTRILTHHPPSAIHHGARSLSPRTDMTKFIVTAMALLSAACPAGAFVSQRRRRHRPIDRPTDRRGVSHPPTCSANATRPRCSTAAATRTP